MYAGVLNPFLEIGEQFGIDNITVIVGLSEQESVLDSFIIVPQAIKSHNGSTCTNVVLKMPYNILYNISVITSLCGQMSTSTLNLNYGEVTFNLGKS